MPHTFMMLPDASSSNGCPLAIEDPADGVRLARVRVLPHGRADYDAGDRYGARADELIRIHCADGSVAGLVPR
jgi:hypothetical protein